jgi:hypothetical protein
MGGSVDREEAENGWMRWWWRRRRRRRREEGMVEDERDWIIEELSVARTVIPRGVWRNLICLGSGVICISSSVGTEQWEQ